MADQNFDPCECLWNHEVAMRRLISLVNISWPLIFCCCYLLSYVITTVCFLFWFHDGSQLRSSQSYCNDNECINDIPGQLTPPQNESNMLFLMMMWAVLALALFFLRPQRRTAENGDHKPTDNQQVILHNPFLSYLWSSLSSPHHQTHDVKHFELKEAWVVLRVWWCRGELWLHYK